MKTILIGYDETEPSKRALERSVELAEKFGSKLIVTSVAPVLIGSTRSAGPIDPVDTVDHHKEELADARAFLEGRNVAADERNIVSVREREEAFVKLVNEIGLPNLARHSD